MDEPRHYRPHRSAQIRALNPAGFDDTSPHFVSTHTVRAPASVLDRYVRQGTFKLQGRECWPDGKVRDPFTRKGLRFAHLDVKIKVIDVPVRGCIWCAEPATKGRFCDECFPYRRRLLALIPEP